LQDGLVTFDFEGFFDKEANVPDDNERAEGPYHWPFFILKYQFKGFGNKEQVTTRHTFDGSGNVATQGKNTFERLVSAELTIDFLTQDDSVYFDIIVKLASLCSDQSDFSGYGFESLKITSSKPVKSYEFENPVSFSMECGFSMQFRMLDSEISRQVFNGLQIIEKYGV